MSYLRVRVTIPPDVDRDDFIKMMNSIGFGVEDTDWTNHRGRMVNLWISSSNMWRKGNPVLPNPINKTILYGPEDMVGGFWGERPWGWPKGGP